MPTRRIPEEDLPVIAQRYRTGESLASIGALYGVSDEAVRQRLEKWAIAGHGDAEYQELVTDYLAENALAAKDKLTASPNMLGVARAREELKFWLWMLERRRPALYGPKQQVQEDRTVRVVYVDPTPTLIAHATSHEGADPA